MASPTLNPTPSFSLSIGTTSFDLTNLSNNLALPGGTAPRDLSPIGSALDFVLTGALTQFLDMPLSQISPPHNSGQLSYSGQHSWTPSAGPVTFTLGGSASATVTVVTEGSIFGQDASGNDVVFYDGFVNPKPIAGFQVPAGWAFIATQLSFGISGSLGATSQFDALGVTANASGSANRTVTHYKAFQVGVKLRDALPVALAQFVLPLHAATATNMDVNDVLAYDFDGTIQVGFGVNYGIKGSIAGYTKDLASTVGDLSKVISVPVSVAPTYTVGADFAVKFPWSSVFQCILQRTGDSAGNVAVLHIFKENKSERNATLSAGILTMSTNASAAVNLDQTTLTTEITQTLFGSAAAPAGFSTAMTTATNELQKYINDVNGYAKKLLTAIPSGNGATGISLIFDSLNSLTSCFQYTFFNVGTANFQQAWDAAMRGDFVAACQVPSAAQLDAGSGFEQFHQSQTTAELQLFGYTIGSSVSTFYDDVTVTYAGGGRFQLASKDGRSYSTSSLAASASTDLYFSTTADSSDTTSASNLVVTLNGVLGANQNPGAVAVLVRLLNKLNTKDATAAAGKLSQYGKNSGPFLLQFAFSSTAYSKITCSPFMNGQPPVDQSNDIKNWNQYAQAVVDIGPSDDNPGWRCYSKQRKFGSYDNWEKFNTELMEGGGSAPANRKLLNTAQALTETVCDAIMGPDTLTDYGLSLTLYERAGQEFMNLCEGLQAIIDDESKQLVGWETVLQDLKVATNDLDPWFGPALMLALVRACGANVQLQTIWTTAGATINISVS